MVRPTMDIAQFEGRKREHIQHSLDPAHQATGLTGLDSVRLIHEALPDFDFSEVRIDAVCLGRSMATPFYVAGMTAGHPDAVQINQTLARACARRGWAMGVGSQRRDLESRSGGSLDQWKQLRTEVPGLVLFGNLGIAQIIPAELDRVRRVVGDLQAQALAVHVNALQEVMQPEGTPFFRGAFAALESLCRDLGTPVLLKETGCGFSARTLERVASIGLAAVDVSGLGGTHWGRIEGARARPDSLYARAAATFAQWGEPTAETVLAARKVFDRKQSSSALWASGGVRSGLDAAKLIALGAERIGYAQPALQAALAGEAALDQWMELQEYELKVALFCTGSRDLHELRGAVGGEKWKSGTSLHAQGRLGQNE